MATTPPSPLHHRLLARAATVLYDELWTVVRGAYLFCLFLPVVVAAPTCVWLGWQREQWLVLVRWTLERAGPAFIKWGQWAATRPDMFPPDLCVTLSRLHSSAPGHSFAYTRHVVEAAFRHPLEEMFDEFEHKPVASGSIAQVLGRFLRGQHESSGTPSSSARLLWHAVPWNACNDIFGCVPASGG